MYAPTHIFERGAAVGSVALRTSPESGLPSPRPSPASQRGRRVYFFAGAAGASAGDGCATRLVSGARFNTTTV